MKFFRRRRRAGQVEPSDGNSDLELTIPTHFRCPISLDLMKDPVTLSTGITYDRENIEKWIEEGNQTCPVTNQILSSFDQIPNHSIRRMIQDWCVQNRAHGIERIPTPRIPVNPHEVSEICSRMSATTQRGDERKCLELLGKLKRLGKESDRNRRCIVDNGAGLVLSVSFAHFSAVSAEKFSNLLEEILSVLVWMFPLGEEGQSNLGSVPSLRSIAGFLKSEDLSTRKIAVVALKELLCLDPKFVNVLMEIEGVGESLFQIVKEPICPTATKSALMVIFYMISPSAISEKIASGFMEIGLTSLILEILVDAGRSICEKALAVLDNICNGEQGIERAREHALIVPVLVKKLLRVSDASTELSVSILWKLCKNNGGEGGGSDSLIEALQVGAFQKVLVLLQVGCGDKTKEKATELLKMMNQHRNKLKCFDSSMDFRYLKRSL